MAFLPKHHLSPFQIHRDFVYRARVMNLIPIYLGELDNDNPNICAVNGCPEWLLDIVLFAIGWVQMFMDHFNIPCAGMPITITARLDGQPIEKDQALDQHSREDM